MIVTEGAPRRRKGICRAGGTGTYIIVFFLLYFPILVLVIGFVVVLLWVIVIGVALILLVIVALFTITIFVRLLLRPLIRGGIAVVLLGRRRLITALIVIGMPLSVDDILRVLP
jgi:hypothetical protein